MKSITWMILRQLRAFLNENIQLTDDGRIVAERDWRRNALSAERSRQEREEERKRAKQRELEQKNNKYIGDLISI